jgi:hypothetical protein
VGTKDNARAFHTKGLTNKYNVVSSRELPPDQAEYCIQRMQPYSGMDAVQVLDECCTLYTVHLFSVHMYCLPVHQYSAGLPPELVYRNLDVLMTYQNCAKTFYFKSPPQKM